MHSGERAIASATRSASRCERAPRTTMSMTLVAPSPSFTIIRANSRMRSVAAAAKPRKSRERGVRGRLPATPLASNSTVSFVLMSPSTTIALNEDGSASLKTRRSAGTDTAASVRMYASIVAMCGAIIPAPLARPAISTSRPSMRSRRDGELAEGVRRHHPFERPRRAVRRQLANGLIDTGAHPLARQRAHRSARSRKG